MRKSETSWPSLMFFTGVMKVCGRETSRTGSLGLMGTFEVVILELEEDLDLVKYVGVVLGIGMLADGFVT